MTSLSLDTDLSARRLAAAQYGTVQDAVLQALETYAPTRALAVGGVVATGSVARIIRAIASISCYGRAPSG